jgi:hypothetical protein
MNTTILAAVNPSALPALRIVATFFFSRKNRRDVINLLAVRGGKVCAMKKFSIL